MARIVTIGEGMLELSQGAQGWRLGSAGDVLNTSVHLARSGHDVAMLTALGDDPFSQSMRQSWQDEGIDTSHVLTNAERGPGLYAVTTDNDGERSFTYWRDTSAARTTFDLPGIEHALAAAETCDLLFFSLISLAILPEDARQRIYALALRVRAHGGRVAFDGNYRPGLWRIPGEARRARDAAIRVASIGLPTQDDEALLSGSPTAEATAAHWTGLACGETVVKLGSEGCRLPDGRVVAPPEVRVPVDTSGAGDAFDAGYLSARLAGATSAEAALAGHELAGRTIMHRGAIPPRRA